LGAEHGGVDEGLKLAEEVGGVWGGGGVGVFDVEQPAAGVAGEVAGLGAEGGGVEALAFGSGDEAGEVDVGGDVYLTGGDERVFGFFVLVVGLEGAGGAVGVVVVFGGVAVVDGDEEARGKGMGGIESEGLDAGVVFRGVGFRECGAEGLAECFKFGVMVDFPWDHGVGLILVEADHELPPLPFFKTDEFDGEGVDKFVGEDRAVEVVEVLEALMAGEFARK